MAGGGRWSREGRREWRAELVGTRGEQVWSEVSRVKSNGIEATNEWIEAHQVSHGGRCQRDSSPFVIHGEAYTDCERA